MGFINKSRVQAPLYTLRVLILHGFIGKSRVQTPLYTARVSILHGFYRQKSCLDPCAYSKGVNITGVIWGKVAIRSCTPIQKMQYDMGCIVKSRAQAPLYTAKVSILQGRYREK